VEIVAFAGVFRHEQCSGGALLLFATGRRMVPSAICVICRLVWRCCSRVQSPPVRRRAPCAVRRVQSGSARALRALLAGVCSCRVLLAVG